MIQPRRPRREGPPGAPRVVAASLSLLMVVACMPAAAGPAAELAVQPRVVTEPVRHDTDDPAIWVNRDDPAASLVLGTDKDVDGALYVFGLDGRIHHDKVVRGLLRPNNVDIAYGVMVGGRRVDVAVVTERFANRLRVYRLPDMAPLDGGGIPVFVGERARDAMGIALHTRPGDGALFAIVSRSDQFAPTDGYLHQYRLVDDGSGMLRGLFVRAFGQWSGRKEIEALAVDNELGYIYASDETYGVRKYHVDPLAEDAEDELAVFAATDIARDHEGLSIYRRPDGTGYILLSDQQANLFRIYPREGLPGRPHEHPLVGTVRLSTLDSDGSDLTTVELPGFPGGLFVAMSTDRTFHLYAVRDLLEAAGLDR
jgi:3-phytase